MAADVSKQVCSHTVLSHNEKIKANEGIDKRKILTLAVPESLSILLYMLDAKKRPLNKHIARVKCEK